MSDMRKAWARYRARPDRLQQLAFLGDRVRVPPEAVEAYLALAAVLKKHGFDVEAGVTDTYSDRKIKGSNKDSLHRYAAAIDINWTWNPFKKTKNKRKVRFATGAMQIERRAEVEAGTADTTMTAAMIADIRAIKTRNGLTVWTWGGDWNSIKDAMHFELAVGPGDLAAGIDPATLPGGVGNVGRPISNTAEEIFQACLHWLDEIEGGFSNRPARVDPGGATKFGITQATLSRWRGRSVSVNDVKRLDYSEATKIYRAFYFDVNQCGRMPKPLALLVFNGGVHSGERTAAEWLQQQLNNAGAALDVDKVVGPLTMAAIAAADLPQLCQAMFNRYQRHLRSLPNFSANPGWTKQRLPSLKTTYLQWLEEWKEDMENNNGGVPAIIPVEADELVIKVVGSGPRKLRFEVPNPLVAEITGKATVTGGTVKFSRQTLEKLFALISMLTGGASAAPFASIAALLLGMPLMAGNADWIQTIFGEMLKQTGLGPGGGDNSWMRQGTWQTILSTILGGDVLRNRKSLGELFGMVKDMAKRKPGPPPASDD